MYQKMTTGIVPPNNYDNFRWKTGVENRTFKQHQTIHFIAAQNKIHSKKKQR